MPVLDSDWTTKELQELHGLQSSGRAIERQRQLDEFISDVLAPHYVERGVRADQATASIAAMIARLAKLFASGDARVPSHITHLIKLAYDRKATQRLSDAGRRLPSETPRPAVKNQTSIRRIA